MGCSKSKIEETNENSESNRLIQSMEIENKKMDIQKLNKFQSINNLSVSYNKDSIYTKSIFKKTKTSPKRIESSKSKREPFNITTIESNSGNIYIIKINGCSFLTEYLIPIWFQKNIYIKFVTKGKWRIDKNYEYSDSAGMPSSHVLNFNYGALVARIGSGESFLLPPNEFTYYTKNEGPLYLKIFLPKKIKVNPEGTMEVKVFDGNLMSIEEIYEKIGWKTKDMSYNNKNSTEIEKDLTTDLNNLRMNPILFYENYIKTSQNKIWTEEFLKTMKNNNEGKGILPFTINNNCHNYLNNYIGLHYNDIKKKIEKRSVFKFFKELEEIISLNIKNDLMYDNYVNCRLSKRIKTTDLCIQYLFDKKFRKNIFKKDYNLISINIADKFFNDSYLIIVAIMKGENNVNEENNNNI